MHEKTTECGLFFLKCVILDWMLIKIGPKLAAKKVSSLIEERSISYEIF